MADGMVTKQEFDELNSLYENNKIEYDTIKNENDTLKKAIDKLKEDHREEEQDNRLLRMALRDMGIGGDKISRILNHERIADIMSRPMLEPKSMLEREKQSSSPMAQMLRSKQEQGGGSRGGVDVLESARNAMARKGVDVLESARKAGTDQKKQELEDIKSQVEELERIEILNKQIQELKRKKASVLESRGLAHSVGHGIEERMRRGGWVSESGAGDGGDRYADPRGGDRLRYGVHEYGGLSRPVSRGIKERMLSMRIDQVRPKSTELSMGKDHKSRGGGKRRVKKSKVKKSKTKKSKRRRRSSRTRRR